MNKQGKNRLTRAVAGGLCSLGLLSYAIASPPFGGGRSSLATVESVLSKVASKQSSARQEHISNTQLDLRLSEDSPPAIIHGGNTALTSTPFPSAIHHLDLGKADFGKDDRVQLSAFGTGGANYRDMSQAEIFARRVHREGLPLARLWESKSALLSIGLNQRGKPGLWLIQKIH
jgi:hypothetical protein